MEQYFDHKIPAKTRKFYDPAVMQSWIKENALEAFDHKLNKIESNDFKLHVTGIGFEKDKPFTLNEQKQAILEKRDLSFPLKGNFDLIDKKTGKSIASKKSVIIAQVPFITPRNTLIINGAEYIAINQQRLKPGVYTRIKESGEAEAHVNVKPGTGLSGKIIFEPEKALFIYSLGTTQIKLYGLLKGLGLSDAEMETAWGKEIFQKNKIAYKGDELNKFHSRISTFK